MDETMKYGTLSTQEADENPTTQKNCETIQSGSLAVENSNANLSGDLQCLSALSTHVQTGTKLTPPLGQVVDIEADISPSARKRKSNVADTSKKAAVLFPSTSKRRSCATPNASKRRKVIRSAISEDIGMGTIGTTSSASLEDAQLWKPEFFIGGNPRMGPLRIDDSALTNEAAAVGLIYGARLPTDIPNFSKCKDAWELYTHIAKCLAGAIGATTELHNRATRHPSTTLETDKLSSYIRKLEEELACKNAKLKEASELIDQKAKKIVDQARQINILVSSQKQMKKQLDENGDHCKMIERNYNEECQKNKAIYESSNRLQLEKKEEEVVALQTAEPQEILSPH